MIQHFQELKQSEAQKLVNSISLITILVAGADGKIDKDEKEWSEKIAKIRTYSNPDVLHDFYVQVGRNFSPNLNQLIDDLPNDTEQRNRLLSAQLSELNDIFPKLELHYAAILYQSLISFAKHVAKASGGFLGIGSINKYEKAWIDLPMLTPVIAPEEED